MTTVSQLKTPSDLDDGATEEISSKLTTLLADVFALFIKTKNFHWHVSGPHFRDYHLLFDEQSGAVLAMVDPIAERVRKLGGTTVRSVAQIASLKTMVENEQPFVTPQNMFEELRANNQALVVYLRELHGFCDLKGDVATASLIEEWIDQAEERIWFLYESARGG
jgi:starvation-inducible DNA-binding protein